MTSPSVEQLNPFQRIVAPLSVTYGPDDLSPSATVSAGRVGDLRADVVRAENKARLTWTSPDMGGNAVARYEIRYARALRSLVDDFDAAPVWTHGAPLPLAPGSETVFAVDVGGKAPELLDQTLYVAVRGYGGTEPDSVPGPVSNWVRVSVPSPPPPPSLITTNPSVASGDPSWTAASDQNNNVIPKIARELEMNYDVMMPVAGVVALLGLLAVLYCTFCAVKRNRKPEKRSPKPRRPEKSLTVSVIPNGGAGGPLSISSPMNAVKAELESHFEPCLIDTGEPKKRYSVAQYGQTGTPGTNDQHFNNNNNNHHQSQLQPRPYHHQSNGHLSVIGGGGGGGGATLTRIPKTGNTYQYWTASQLLHEHERRTSPYSHMGDFDGQYPPPVPPLPAYQQQQQQQQQHHQQAGGNAENIYGTAPGHNYQPQQNGLPPPGQYNNNNNNNNSGSNYHRNNMILFNQSLQGSLSSVSSGDKKKRNITMV